MGTVRKIYTHFGLELSDAYAQQLTQHIADNPRGKHGAHQYTSADFDLTDAQIRERFSGYIERYKEYTLKIDMVNFQGVMPELNPKLLK